MTPTDDEIERSAMATIYDRLMSEGDRFLLDWAARPKPYGRLTGLIDDGEGVLGGLHNSEEAVELLPSDDE